MHIPPPLHSHLTPSPPPLPHPSTLSHLHPSSLHSYLLYSHLHPFTPTLSHLSAHLLYTSTTSTPSTIFSLPLPHTSPPSPPRLHMSSPRSSIAIMVFCHSVEVSPLTPTPAMVQLGWREEHKSKCQFAKVHSSHTHTHTHTRTRTRTHTHTHTHTRAHIQ